MENRPEEDRTVLERYTESSTLTVHTTPPGTVSYSQLVLLL